MGLLRKFDKKMKDNSKLLMTEATFSFVALLAVYAVSSAQSGHGSAI